MKTVVLIRSRAIDPSVKKVAESLSENGYTVKLLVWDRQNNLEVQTEQKYKICKFYLRAPYDKISVIFYFPIWWLYEFYFLIRNNPDVIHACDLDTLIPAIPVKLIKKVKLFYTIYDFYADNIQKKFPVIIKKIVAFIEKTGIKFVDVLFLVDECRYEQVKGAEIKNLVYIYNSPSESFIKPSEQKIHGKSEFEIFYAGIIHRSRGLESIVNVVRDLDNVVMIIAGTGPDIDLIQSTTTDMKNKVQYIGFITYDTVIKKTFESDLIFAFYDPDLPNNRYASPNKLFEAMMCKKPIIVNKDTNIANIVEREKCGLVIPYGDEEAIKKAILSLKSNPQLSNQLGENGRKAYENKYNWKNMEKRLLDSYEKLTDSIAHET